MRILTGCNDKVNASFWQALSTMGQQTAIKGTPFGRNPFEKGFLPSHFPKTFKSFWKGVKGKTLFQKGFPLNLMTLHPKGE